MAMAWFSSGADYQIAPIHAQGVSVGEPVFAAGFPMYYKGTLNPTFDQGIQAFQFN